MPARIALLVTSPRLPAGLLAAAAWDLVRARPVFTAAESGQAGALRAAGVPVTVTGDPVHTLLSTGDSVWLAGPDGDPELAAQLRQAGARVEVVQGSWDPPGARLLDVVSVMDRLASPGGDPWKLAQTHESLARFLLEEAYEALDAIASGDRDALREELGDVLLQVVLHARLASNQPGGWSIDEVAGDLAEKMIRRNPHVFAGAPTRDIEEITQEWERIKREEKARGSALDGIVYTQPALALATKIISRARRSGAELDLPAGDGLGERLLRTAAEAQQRDEDAEGALRAAALRLADAIRAREGARKLSDTR
ncbi:MAG: MazG family protein [Micromonosporaceae bacterium]|nr:MazG family protein [Micromonosporaceae bacterium]